MSMCGLSHLKGFSQLDFIPDGEPMAINIEFADDLYVVNHSGGKDSQALFLHVSKFVPKEQLVVIHAHLPGVEWEGVIDHIKATIGDVEFHVVQAKMTFFEMVRQRGMWPSPKYRQCTSDLKRGPIRKKIIEIANARKAKRVFNCMGLRAEESSNRAKLYEIKFSEKLSNRKREWYDLNPIHKLSTRQVVNNITEAGQRLHWAYYQGMTRLSCKFCIMSSIGDLKTSAKLNPEDFKEYNLLEREIDQTFMMPSKSKGRKFLNELIKTNEEN